MWGQTTSYDNAILFLKYAYFLGAQEIFKCWIACGFLMNTNFKRAAFTLVFERNAIRHFMCQKLMNCLYMYILFTTQWMSYCSLYEKKVSETEKSALFLWYLYGIASMLHPVRWKKCTRQSNLNIQTEMHFGFNQI